MIKRDDVIKIIRNFVTDPHPERQKLIRKLNDYDRHLEEMN